MLQYCFVCDIAVSVSYMRIFFSRSPDSDNDILSARIGQLLFDGIDRAEGGRGLRGDGAKAYEGIAVSALDHDTCGAGREHTPARSDARYHPRSRYPSAVSS